MTLTEARRVLEDYQAWRTYEGPVGEGPIMPRFSLITEALDMAVAQLPSGEVRKPAAERYMEIRCAIAEAKDGFDPFRERSRDKVSVCWRQCVWRKLKSEGYHAVEVARVTGYDHATVWYALQRLDDFLYTGDLLAVRTWEDLNRIVK